MNQEQKRAMDAAFVRLKNMSLEEFQKEMVEATEREEAFYGEEHAHPCCDEKWQKLEAEAALLRERSEVLLDWVKEAYEVIYQGAEIMTLDQFSKWKGAQVMLGLADDLLRMTATKKDL